MSDDMHDSIGHHKHDNKPPVYFNLLFYGLILWGTLFCAYYLLSGWSSTGEYAEKQAAHDLLTADK